MDNPPSSIGAGRPLDTCRYISIGVHCRVFTDRFPARDKFSDIKNRRINIKIVFVILILGENKRHIFSSCCEKSITSEGENYESCHLFLGVMEESNKVNWWAWPQLCV